MIKMKVFQRAAVWALFPALVVISSGLAWAGEKQTADGFVGVSWGASRLQVASLMKEKGFTLITNKAKNLYDADIYRGTFADYPADLYFHYNGKDFFDSGWAFLLSVQGSSLDVAMSGYYDIVPLLKAKYGAFDQELAGEEFRLGSWNNIPAKGTSPGVAEIKVQGGRIPDFSRKNKHLYGVWVQYRYRPMKDI